MGKDPELPQDVDKEYDGQFSNQCNSERLFLEFQSLPPRTGIIDFYSDGKTCQTYSVPRNRFVAGKNAIEHVPNRKNTWVFTVQFLWHPKSRANCVHLRPILNLKNLNRFLQHKKFKMETLRSIKKALRPNDWAASPEGRILPCANLFSASEVPPLFCSRKTIPVQGSSFRSIICPENFHQNGVCDRGTPETSGYSHLPVLRRLANKRFWLADFEETNCIEIEKGAGVPSQHREILFHFNATGEVSGSRLGPVRRNCQASREQMQSACGESNEVLQQPYTDCSAVSSFVGPYCRNIGNGSTCPSIIKTNLGSSSGVLEASVNGLQQKNSHNTSFAETSAVVRWLQKVNLRKGIPLENSCPSWTLTADASLESWGAYLGSHVIKGKWDQLQVTYHINLLELLAVCNALNHFCHMIKGSHVMIRTDNSTVVNYIMKQGGTHSPTLCIWTWKMWTFSYHQPI